jgi:hypothetical protein
LDDWLTRLRTSGLRGRDVDAGRNSVSDTEIRASDTEIRLIDVGDADDLWPTRPIVLASA